MAAGPITVRIDSETKAFKQGIDAGIIDPLEDADKALADLGKSRGPEQLERELKDAQRATEKLGDQTQDEARKIERAYRDVSRSADDAGQTGAHSMGRIKEGAAELSQEFGQNLGETVASFRGDLSDLGQVGQDTLGGLAATLSGTGPAGMVGAAALAAGAVGLGLVTGAQKDIEEHNEKMRQSAADWADAYIEAGGRVLSFEQQASKVRDILTDPDKYKEAAENARQWGVDTQIAVEAIAGSPTALDMVQEAYNRLAQSGDEMLKKFADHKISAGELAQWKLDVDNGKKALDDLTGSFELGQQQADIYSRYLRDVATTTEGATSAVDEFGDTVVTLPDGKQIYIDAETGRATENVDAITAKIYGVPDKESTVRVRVDDSDVTNYRPPRVIGETWVTIGTRNATWQ